MCHFQHIISKVLLLVGFITVDIGHLAEVVFVRFLHSKVIFSHSSQSVFLEGSHFVEPTLSERSYTSLLFGEVST